MRRVIRRRIRKRVGGIDLAAEINAVVSTNEGEEGSDSRVSSRSRIVQTVHRTAEEHPPEDHNEEHDNDQEQER